jgi:hypothetical protein
MASMSRRKILSGTIHIYLKKKEEMIQGCEVKFRMINLKEIICLKFAVYLVTMD